MISWGPWGLLLLGVLDSVGVPIIGGVDALLIAVSTIHPSQAYLAAVCAIVGSVTGSYILFSVARKGGQLMLARHTSHGRGLRLRRWFERFGLLTVFIPAISPIPLPMKIPVFCAGALEVRTRSFMVVVIFARIVRYFALAALGIRYGQYTVPFLKHHWPSITMIVIGLCLLVIAALQVVNRRRSAKIMDVPLPSNGRAAQ